MKIKKYNYKNCKSLFGYSAKVHIRYKAKCQLCGCGGEPLDFDMWRQLTIEHLIGKSQGGYLKQIKKTLIRTCPQLKQSEVEKIATKIDTFNTVTACQFCNSTTSRDKSNISMDYLIEKNSDNLQEMLIEIKNVCNKVLERKRKTIRWKLDSIREAYDNEVKPKIIQNNLDKL